MGILQVYKNGQGVWVRRLTMLTVLGVGLFSSVALWKSIVATAGVPGKKYLGFIPIEWAGRSLGGWEFGGFSIAPALLIGIGLFGLFAYLGFFLAYGRPKSGEFLIETEKEMRKVSWPSWRELKGSSVVVVVVTFFLGCYLMVVDIALSAIMGVFF